MKKLLIALALLIVAALAACTEPEPEVIEVEVTRIVEVEVEKIVEVEVEVPVEIEVEVTRIVEVEIVGDAPAPIPSGAAFDPKQGTGVYLVGVDIAPGIWRSSGTGDSDGDCWLRVNNLGGDYETASIEPVGVSHRIPAGDFQVVLNKYSPECTWTYVSE